MRAAAFQLDIYSSKFEGKCQGLSTYLTPNLSYRVAGFSLPRGDHYLFRLEGTSQCPTHTNDELQIDLKSMVCVGIQELDWAAVQDHLVISVPKLQRRDGRCPVPHPCVMEQVYSPRNWPPERDGSAALLVFCTEDRLVCVDAMLRVTTWAWSGLPNGKGLPFTLGTCRTTQLPSRYLHKSKAGAKRPPLLTKMAAVSTSSALEGSITPRMGTRLLTALKGSFTQSMSPGESVLVPGQNRVGYEEVTSIPPRSIGRVHSCFGLCTASGGNSDSLLCCGYWDHAVRRYSIDSSTKLILGDQGTGGHEGAINCLSIADGGSLLVTGGQDATCRVWVVGNASMALALGSADTPQAVNGVPGRENMVCVNVLYGHEAPITCLAVSEVSSLISTP